ncbi:hypothetical protein VR41_13355 [Streptomyces sp. NRRL B-1568]|nr:hypothetical protein VR41_13355 [Streptomyces sp. NRRL B-1568]
MLGWGINISIHTPNEAGPDTTGQAHLARWDAGLAGLNWITELVKAGKAEQQSDCGYPCLYTARAGDVLPLLADGTPPADGMPGNVWMHPERMAACSAEQILTIEAWDRS